MVEFALVRASSMGIMRVDEVLAALLFILYRGFEHDLVDRGKVKLGIQVNLLYLDLPSCRGALFTELECSTHRIHRGLSWHIAGGAGGELCAHCSGGTGSKLTYESTNFSCE